MKKTSMENKVTTYYTLRYEQTDSIHKKGELICIPSGELCIGQQEVCQVRFQNTSDFEDEQYAVIRSTRNDGEWQLIPTSEHVKTFVNGSPVNLLHYLNDGDRISFDDEEQELLFSIHHDDKLDATKGIQVVAAPFSRRLLAFIIALPFVLFSLLVGYFVNEHSKDEKINLLLNGISSNILQISVDSVYYVEVSPQGEKPIRAYSYLNEEGHVINGTAFLTSDSCIVTARHCIEPWLNDPTIDEIISLQEIKSTPSRWAMEAESYNQQNDSSICYYKVVAICSFYRGQNGTEKFGRDYRSSEFIVDTSRDNVIEKGDFNDVYYWRSIKETYSNKEVMLGDVAWVHSDSSGIIKLASEEQISKLLTRSQRLYFMGYPDYNTMRGFNIEEGKLQMEYEKSNMIAHGGNLIHGYSGAPVIVIDGDTACAVGVVSRLDANGGNRTYSVPVNELKGKEVRNE